MADSQLILELLFLQRRGGCSLTVLLFFLMLVGTCCFILSASLCVVRPTWNSRPKLLKWNSLHGIAYYPGRVVTIDKEICMWTLFVVVLLLLMNFITIEKTA